MDRLVAGLVQRLAPHPVPPHVDGRRQAAVAVVLHERPRGGPCVLLMKRAERVGDPWSGHISLPGGGYQATDRDLLTTARRETCEELGIDLASTRALGSLTVLQPISSGPSGIEVTPFVFVTAREPAPVCGPEALSAFWLPLTRAAAGELNGTFLYRDAGGAEYPFPSWDFAGHVIWGLTFRILQEVLDAGREGLPRVDLTPAG